MPSYRRKGVIRRAEIILQISLLLRRSVRHDIWTYDQAVGIPRISLEDKIAQISHASAQICAGKFASRLALYGLDTALERKILSNVPQV